MELAALVLWIWLGSILRKLLWGDELNWELASEEVLMVVKVRQQYTQASSALLSAVSSQKLLVASKFDREQRSPSSSTPPTRKAPYLTKSLFPLSEAYTALIHCLALGLAHS